MNKSSIENCDLFIESPSTIDPNFKKKSGKRFKFIDFQNPTSKTYLKNNEDYSKWKKYYEKNSNGEIAIEEETNKFAGYVFINNEKSGSEGFIMPLSVEKEFRGYGLGERLLKDAIRKYNGQDLVVDVDNEVAVHLYKKNGFKIVGYADPKTKKQYYMKLNPTMKTLHFWSEVVSDPLISHLSHYNGIINIKDSDNDLFEESYIINDKDKIIEEGVDDMDDCRYEYFELKDCTSLCSFPGNDMYLEDAHELNDISGDIIPVYFLCTFTYTTFGKIVKSVTGAKYSHSSIGFDSSLENLYSFNAATDRDHGGLSFESVSGYAGVSDKAEILVGAVFISKKQFKRVRAYINNLVKHAEETRYNVNNLFNIVINRPSTDNNDLRMICSQFVDSVLKLAGIDLSGKDSSITQPIDFVNSTSKRIYLVYEGFAKDYDKRKTNRIIAAIKTAMRKGKRRELLGESFEIIDKELDELSSFMEGSVDKTTILSSTIWDRVNATLSKPEGDRAFRKIVSEYLQRNMDKLVTSGPVYLIIFGDSDKEMYWDLFGITESEVKAAMTELTSKISGSDFRLLRNNPIFALFYYVIRFYTKKNDEKGVNIALSIYALSVYWSIYMKYFPKGFVDEAVMQYTIDNLTDKFLIKKCDHIFGTLVESIKRSYKFHKPRILVGNDDDCIAWIQRIRNDQNSLIKKIANEYNKNYTAGNRVRTRNDDYDPDNPILDTIENATTAVANHAQKVSMPIISNGVDIQLATAAAKFSSISVADIRQYLMKIIVPSKLEEFQEMISAVLFIFIYEEKHEIRDIRTESFLNWGGAMFKKTNSKDKNVETINRLLEAWAIESGIYERFGQTTRINYKKAIFWYIIMSIQKYS